MECSVYVSMSIAMTGDLANAVLRKLLIAAALTVVNSVQVELMHVGIHDYRGDITIIMTMYRCSS